jgi:hypothetical protein
MKRLLVYLIVLVALPWTAKGQTHYTWVSGNDTTWLPADTTRDSQLVALPQIDTVLRITKIDTVGWWVEYQCAGIVGVSGQWIGEVNGFDACALPLRGVRKKPTLTPILDTVTVYEPLTTNRR